MAGKAVGTPETVFDPDRRLPASALARFVALAGAMPDTVAPMLASDAPASTPPELSAMGDAWWHIDLDQAAALGTRLEAVPDIGAFCTGLDQLWSQAAAAGPVRGLLSGGPADLDAVWLTQLLAWHGPMGAVTFDHSQWRAPLFDWPLNVGLPPSAEGRSLAQVLQNGWFRELYEPLVVRGGEALDVLLYPGPLSQALRSARRSTQRCAGLVVVLGPFDQAAGADALRELAQCWSAAAVVVCGLDASHWSPWFFELVAALSHNLPIPQAVFEAQRRALPQADPSLPVVLCDVGYADHSRPLEVARRLADVLRRQSDDRPLTAPPEVGPVAEATPELSAASAIANALESAAEQWPWTSETQGTTLLVRTRRALEQQLGPIELRRDPRFHAATARMEPPEAMTGDEPPPTDAPAEPAPPRHVKFDLWPVDAAEAPREPMPLTPEADHRLEVFIAELGVAAQGTADAPLDERLLPPSADGHELTIVYCPLSPTDEFEGKSHTPAPSMATLHLPPRGTSTRAVFTLRCGAAVASFRARLIVLHAQRVIQSLLLLPDATGGLTLSVENRYAPGLDSPSADHPADLAFLINDNADGVSGLTTMAPDRASFLTPDGMKESIAQMRKILNAAVQAEAGNTDQRLDRPELLDLMRQLANHGAVIVEELSMQHPLALLDAARRVQVVEAVDQAYFPVEFLYAGPAPEPGAALCPNARAALADGSGAVHDQCPHRLDEGHVCPVSFWGFRKCIERHAPNGDAATVVSVPVPGQERLGPFTSALLAASDRAHDEMEGPDGLPAAVAARVADVTTVTTWADWKAQVMARPRDLLLLMPHSDKSSVFAGIPSLEVSKDELAASNLSEKYVYTGTAHGPLVLLLGCSTSFADLPFLNFVRRFHLKGAPAVVGTLSVVHATQAHRIAQRLLALALAPEPQALRLDEALLQLRRDLLAEGNGVSFTLMAYGHSAWRL
ncbi:hypothetical protein [Hydrogenophaga sp. RWCD_12]|uniref:hypothetical protein n=1 Tax=Hydrogenophaga sp. RWCD_12 TaxID=3391190 RepID=UPI0039850BCD